MGVKRKKFSRFTTVTSNRGSRSFSNCNAAYSPPKPPPRMRIRVLSATIICRAFGKLLTVRWEICATATGRHQQVDRPTRNGWRFFWQKLQKLLWVPGFFRSKEASQCWLRCEIKVWRESMARSGQKNSAPLCAESNSGSARSEVIKLIRHRLHEPLGPTLLVLQLLLREESLSPQGVALIRMLQRSIKEEVRAIQELLTIIERFIQEPVQADSRTE